MSDFDRESMLEMFIFEMNTLVEQLEQIIVKSETGYDNEQINEIFRIMHTIKGSAAMMLFNDIASVAHVIEDLFYYLREENPANVDYPALTDHVLAGADFVKEELGKIQAGQDPDGNAADIAEGIKQFLDHLKNPNNAPTAAASTAQAAQPATTATPTATVNHEGGSGHWYKALITFEDGCEMENIRAYTLVHNLQDHATDITHTPEDVINEEAIEFIRKNGFVVEFSSAKDYDGIHAHLMQTVYLRDLSLEEIVVSAPAQVAAPASPAPVAAAYVPPASDVSEAFSATMEMTPPKPPVLSSLDESKKSGAPAQLMISVGVNKLDALLNLMGELVISEAMVTQNSELDGLQLDSFNKEARQLRKIINNLQETVMSMRMIPLSGTFFKMHRIVRDMCRALDKDVQLEIIGEETEVDKNIIEHIADPIMHIIRNSIDHGIELPADRLKAKKSEKGKVVLQALNSGGDVLILIKDDGRGLNRDRIMQKAKDNGLLSKPEAEYTDKEVHQFIFKPGFSTNAQVTAYSGRGVGMDVVVTNLEVVGGTVLVESVPGEGSVFTLKIPLTLAIIEGMTIHMAGAKYTIPIASIKRSFKPDMENVFTDPDGNEMITDRGEIYNIVRLHEFFGIENAITNLEDGILMQLENGDEIICLLVDELIGEQQAVVQAMPKYFNKVQGLSGCTLLGNGDISLIIDVAGFFDK